MSGQNQIVVARMNLDVEHRHARQVVLELLPVVAAVEGHEESVFSAREQQITIPGMLAHDMQRAAILRQAVRDIGPMLAVVGGLEEVDVEVVGAMSVEGHIGGAGVKRGGDDAADISALGNAGDVRNDILPGLAVAADLQVAVVRSRPNDSSADRRLADGGRGRIVGDAIIARKHLAVFHLAAHDLKLAAVGVGGQIGSHGLPVVALVGRFEYVIAAVIEGLAVVLRNQHRRVPLEAVA